MLKRNIQRIVRRFNRNIKNKPINFYKTHHGSEGHWLETKMGLRTNGNNRPDIFGFEMKKASRKITLGDFAASEYIFRPKKVLKKYNKNLDISRDEFIKTFGTPKKDKNNRYSWSGSCVPTFGQYNDYGQKIIINKTNSIYIIYRHTKDLYIDQKPSWCKESDFIVLAYWDKNILREKIEKKFNNNGFFILSKENDVYTTIQFGHKITYEKFIENVKNKNIFFDSGMYEGNTRMYSQWRSKSSFMNSLIYRSY